MQEPQDWRGRASSHRRITGSKGRESCRNRGWIDQTSHGLYTPAFVRDALGFAAPSMRSEVEMEGFMLIRIRHCDKNIASMEQPGVFPFRPKSMLDLQASYTAIATAFGVLCGST